MIIDISREDKKSQDSLIIKERDRLSHYVFKPDQWPLFDIQLFKLSEEKNYILFGIDMIIADGTSLNIFIKDTMYYYNNPNSELPVLDFSFRDYIMAYKKFKESEIYQEDKEYFLNKLDDIPSGPSILLKQPPAKIEKPFFKRKQKYFSKTEWGKLK